MQTLITSKMITRKSISIFFIALALICGCSDDNETTKLDGTPKYIVALSLPAIESYPFHILSDVTSGVADISQSQEIPGSPNNVAVTTSPGFVYLNSAEKFTKYSVDENGILKDEGSVPNKGLSGGPVSTFLSPDRLLVSTGPRQNASGIFSYQIINTSTMTEESAGTITLPLDANSTAIPSNYIVKDGKIYVPYIHADKSYVSYAKAPVAIYNATTLAYEKTIYEERTASLSYSVVSSHGFSENGDLYLISCNSNYWAANETLPSGIARIKAGESEFDASYFFNITEALDGNHTGGMLYVGNNKAIVQVFNSKLITKYADYQNGYVIEYYLADLKEKTLEKLNVPLSKYPRKALALLNNGKAVIMINSQSEGNALYIFDPKNETVVKGLTYEGAEFMNGFLSFE